MINKFKEKKYDYMSLFQDQVFGKHPVSYSYNSNNSNNNMEHQNSVSNLSEFEKNSIKQFVNVGRNSLDIQENHKYLISFAWVTPQ